MSSEIKTSLYACACVAVHQNIFAFHPEQLVEALFSVIISVLICSWHHPAGFIRYYRSAIAFFCVCFFPAIGPCVCYRFQHSVIALWHADRVSFPLCLHSCGLVAYSYGVLQFFVLAAEGNLAPTMNCFIQASLLDAA
jgi:prolipoprotein diacylglyceryltransferase